MALETAIYARQSIDKKDSISIETQIEICKKETFLEEHIVIYKDKGFSGKNTNRPAFAAMMNCIRSGKMKRVIVYKLDRISRSVLDFSRMMEEFSRHKVEFVSCTEKFDTSTAMGRAMLNIAVVFAQLERETIQARVSDAYYSRSHKGYYMGGRVPYGFRLENAVIDGVHTSKFVEDPEEVEKIRRIYEEYAKPEGTLGSALRSLLEAEEKTETECDDVSEDNAVLENKAVPENKTVPGCEAVRGRAPLSSARISEIIRNPVYVRADIEVYHFFLSQGARIINPVEDFIGTNGIFLYKGRDGDGKKRKQYDLKDREVVIAPHEGVIDSELWLACRVKLMKNRQLSTVRKGMRSYLTGKVKCKKCGYAYQVIQSEGTKTLNRYFRCSGARYSIKCTGAGHTIYADELEEYVRSEIKKVLEQFSYLSDECERQQEPVCNHYKIRIASIEKEIEDLLEKVASANDSLMVYINKRVETLDGEKQELQKKMAKITSEDDVFRADKITGFTDKWDELELIDKQRIVDILIDHIEIGEGEMEIFWNI